MIGVIQTNPAPYRDETFTYLENTYGIQICAATFCDGMDTHPEWNYTGRRTTTVYHKFLTIRVGNRKLVYNKDVTQWLKSKTWETLYVEGYSSLTNLQAIVYARMHNIPLIMGADTVECNRFYKAKDILYQNSAALWVSGKRSKDYFLTKGIPEEKIFMGKYTYDYEKFRQITLMENCTQLRKTLKIQNNNFVFLFVGKLIATRRIDVLLTALKQIHDDSIKIILIGDGPDNKLTTDYAKTDSRVIHIPQVPLAELYKYYALADAYVHPGAEPYSLAVVQAVAAGLGIVSTDAVGAIDDVVVNGVNGYIVKLGDAEALKLALEKLKRNNMNLREGIENQQENLIKKKSVPYAAEQLALAYEYALKQKKK